MRLLRAAWLALVTAVACRMNEHSLMMALIISHGWRGEAGILLDGTHFAELTKMRTEGARDDL
jgi:hypothetical protein